MPVLAGNTAERLKELRERSGLTQEQLSRELEKRGFGYFDRATISRVETEKTTRVNMELIQALAKLYGVTVDFILGMTDVPEKKSYEIFELGLSYGAARKLIRRDVNPKALNLILECEGAQLLCEMIAGYFTTEMSNAYWEMTRLFPEIRGMGCSAEELDLQLTDAEKRRFEADLSILQDPMELQKGVVMKQFEIVVEEMRDAMVDGAENPEPLKVGNSELIGELQKELKQRKRRLDLARVSPEKKAAAIARIAARRMNMPSDAEELLGELYLCMMRHLSEEQGNELQKAQ